MWGNTAWPRERGHGTPEVEHCDYPAQKAVPDDRPIDGAAGEPGGAGKLTGRDVAARAGGSREGSRCVGEGDSLLHLGPDAGLERCADQKRGVDAGQGGCKAAAEACYGSASAMDPFLAAFH